MKDIRLALRALLIADPAVAAILVDRVYAGVLPQGQRLPSAVYNRISELADYHMQGPSGLAQARIQIDAWATTADGATELADAVRDRLSGFAGTVPYGANSPPDSVEVRAAFLENGREDYDPQANLHRMSRDFLVWYAER